MFQFTLIFISFLFIYFSSTYIFQKINLVDRPNNFSKFHNTATAYSGGTYFFISLIIVNTFFFNLFKTEILIYLFFIYFISLIDDIFIINSYLKLIFQSVIILCLILLNSEIVIYNLGDFENIGLVKLSYLGIPFTFICFLLLINSINFIDGIDGLCAFNFLVFLLMILFIKFYFENTLNTGYLILVLTTLVFLFFNLFTIKFKSFLGDSGSTLIGLMSAYIICYEVNSNEYFHPALAAWLLCYPVFDIFSTIMNRFIDGKNIFFKDSTHFHHLLSRVLLSKKATLSVVFLYILLLNFLGFISFVLIGPFFSLIIFITLNFIHYAFSNKIKKKYKPI